MTAAILIAVIYVAIIWLVFFKLKLLKFSIPWGVASFWVGVHLVLAFVLGLRFVTPNSSNATVIQHTIQLVPRLSEPTLVTAVLVEEGSSVKKGQPLFQFDRRPYEYKVQQLEAQLAAAKQNVAVLKSDLDAATQKSKKMKTLLKYQQFRQGIFDKLAREGAARANDIAEMTVRVNSAEASEEEARAEVERARLKYESEINGINTTVATIEAELKLAQYYLGNTTMEAPEDGRIINLQVRPGMVSGILRAGGIAAFIADADRYVLATFYQENLKWVRPGQPVEVALDLYPGQIFAGKVDSIWKGNGVGQYLPSDNIPIFQQPDPRIAQGQYAVKILLADKDQSKFPIGAQGSAAIYTSQGAWAVLRRISIRTRSWMNWLYPINI
jgi:multidrug resistance efflux pump